eukprot:SAG31_NODE_3265_length_4480_cov_19.931066_2_plen_162_part_00
MHAGSTGSRSDSPTVPHWQWKWPPSLALLPPISHSSCPGAVSLDLCYLFVGCRVLGIAAVFFAMHLTNLSWCRLVRKPASAFAQLIHTWLPFNHDPGRRSHSADWSKEDADHNGIDCGLPHCTAACCSPRRASGCLRLHRSDRWQTHFAGKHAAIVAIIHV